MSLTPKWPPAAFHVGEYAELDGATFTGTVETPRHIIDRAGPAHPELTFQRDGTDVWTVRGGDTADNTELIVESRDAFGALGEPLILETDRVRFDGPGVNATPTLPAIAPGLNGAIRLTASSGSTGRFAINGREIGDTGWRDVTDICVSGSLDPANVGQLQMRRQGHYVTYRLVNLLMASGVGSIILVNGGIASGFRLPATAPASFLQFLANRINSAIERQNLAVFSQRIDWHSVTVTTTGVTSSARPAIGISGEITFVTEDPWPATLPGTAVPGSPPFSLV
jgi:hypothetical protein